MGVVIDDHLFLGSLNIGNNYSGVRYGDSNFRDLNMIMHHHNTHKARNFFKEMLLRNVVFYPSYLDEDKILTDFFKMDITLLIVNQYTSSP